MVGIVYPTNEIFKFLLDTKSLNKDNIEKVLLMLPPGFNYDKPDVSSLETQLEIVLTFQMVKH